MSSFTAINQSGNISNNVSNNNPVATATQAEWAGRAGNADNYNAGYPQYPRPPKLNDTHRPVQMCTLHAFHSLGNGTLSVQQIYQYYNDNFDREAWSTGTHPHQKDEATTWRQTIRRGLCRKRIPDKKVVLVGNQQIQGNERLFEIVGDGQYRVNHKVDLAATLVDYIGWFTHRKPARQALHALMDASLIPTVSGPAAGSATGPATGPATAPATAAPAVQASPLSSVSDGTISPNTASTSPPIRPTSIQASTNPPKRKRSPQDKTTREGEATSNNGEGAIGAGEHKICKLTGRHIGLANNNLREQSAAHLSRRPGMVMNNGYMSSPAYSPPAPALRHRHKTQEVNRLPQFEMQTNTRPSHSLERLVELDKSLEMIAAEALLELGANPRVHKWRSDLSAYSGFR